MRYVVVAIVLGWVGLASAQFDHLTCFKAKSRFKLKGEVDLDATLDAFDLAGCTVVGKPKLVCVPTSKTVGTFTVSKQPGTPLPVSGPEPVPPRLCYKVKCPKPSTAALVMTDQFGEHALSKFKAKMLCTPAIVGPLPSVCQSSADCAPGEFCASIAEDGVGNLPVSCTSGNPGGLPLLADCATSEECETGLCLAGACSVACRDNGDCSGGTCTAFAGIDAPGLCQPTCDVLLQDCASGDGCYLTLQTGVAMCAAPSVAGMQGDACMFVNACAPGYGCLLPDDPVTPTGLVCAYFCDALGGSPGCADGPGPAFACVAINEFYADAPPGIPDAVGLCVDPNVFPIP
jgi:hypothetical protein